MGRCVARWSSQDLVETQSALFMCGLELLWAHAAEMTVPTGSIVEAIDVIGHVAERQHSVLVDLLLDLFLFEAAEEGLSDGIDAPMSRRRLSAFQIRQKKRIELTDDVAFETSTNLGERASLQGALLDVGLRADVTSHPSQRDRPQRVVGLAVPTAIQPVPDDLSRRRLERAHPA
jgi:hypothetical protein